MRLDEVKQRRMIDVEGYGYVIDTSESCLVDVDIDTVDHDCFCAQVPFCGFTKEDRTDNEEQKFHALVEFRYEMASSSELGFLKIRRIHDVLQDDSEVVRTFNDNITRFFNFNVQPLKDDIESNEQLMILLSYIYFRENNDD